MWLFIKLMVRFEYRLAIISITYHSVLRVPDNAEVPSPNYVTLASRHPGPLLLGHRLQTVNNLLDPVKRTVVLFQRTANVMMVGACL